MAKLFAAQKTGGYGIVQTLTEGSTAEKAEVRGADGKVTDEIAYSRTDTASMEYVSDGDEDAFSAGTELTIGALTALIVSSEVTDSNTDYRRGSVSIEKKDSATQVEYS